MSDPFQPPEASEAPSKPELEEEWQREKAVKQHAAQRPSAKRPLRVAGIIIAALLVVGAAVGIGYLATRDTEPGSQGAADRVKPDRVKIEIKGKPAMTVTMNGKKIGKTPLTIVVPKSDQPLRLEGRYIVQKFARMGAKEVREEKTVTRTIVPDREMAIELSE